MNKKGTLTGIVVASMISFSGCGEDPQPQPTTTQPVQQAPAPATETPASPSYETHTVQQGEWLYQLARERTDFNQPRLNEYVRDTCALNELDDCDRIFPDQELRFYDTLRR